MWRILLPPGFCQGTLTKPEAHQPVANSFIISDWLAGPCFMPRQFALLNLNRFDFALFAARPV
tara:strand:+ start:1889 stop:2077 length:189 start_codon:yes stop_codon:yes gene_type:complete